MYLLLEPNWLPPDNAGNENIGYHDDVMTYKRFKLYRPFVFPFLQVLINIRAIDDLKHHDAQGTFEWTIKSYVDDPIYSILSI